MCVCLQDFKEAKKEANDTLQSNCVYGTLIPKPHQREATDLFDWRQGAHLQTHQICDYYTRFLGWETFKYNFGRIFQYSLTIKEH